MPLPMPPPVPGPVQGARGPIIDQGNRTGPMGAGGAALAGMTALLTGIAQHKDSKKKKAATGLQSMMQIAELGGTPAAKLDWQQGAKWAKELGILDMFDADGEGAMLMGAQQPPQQGGAPQAPVQGPAQPGPGMEQRVQQSFGQPSPGQPSPAAGPAPPPQAPQPQKPQGHQGGLGTMLHGMGRALGFGDPRVTAQQGEAMQAWAGRLGEMAEMGRAQQKLQAEQATIMSGVFKGDKASMGAAFRGGLIKSDNIFALYAMEPGATAEKAATETLKILRGDAEMEIERQKMAAAEKKFTWEKQESLIDGARQMVSTHGGGLDFELAYAYQVARAAGADKLANEINGIINSFPTKAAQDMFYRQYQMSMGNAQFEEGKRQFNLMENWRAKNYLMDQMAAVRSVLGEEMDVWQQVLGSSESSDEDREAAKVAISDVLNENKDLLKSMPGFGNVSSDVIAERVSKYFGLSSDVVLRRPGSEAIESSGAGFFPSTMHSFFEGIELTDKEKKALRSLPGGVGPDFYNPYRPNSSAYNTPGMQRTQPLGR